MGTKKGWRTSLNFKIAFVVILHLVTIACVIAAHLKWESAPSYVPICVGLAVECIMLTVIFATLYGHIFEDLGHWIHGDFGPTRFSELISSVDTLISVSYKINQVHDIFDKEMITDLKRVNTTTIPLQFIYSPPEPWPFNYLANQIRERFASDCQDIAQGHCTINMATIPDVSLEVPNHIESGAFCTAVEGRIRIFYLKDRGPELVQKQYDAAERIAKSLGGDKRGFSRLYIFKDIKQVSWRDFRLMRDNDAHCIEVLVIDMQTALSIMERYSLTERNMDFGRWSDKLLMEIRPSGNIELDYGSDKDEDIAINQVSSISDGRLLYITHIQGELDVNRRVISALRSRSMAYKDFYHKFCGGSTISSWTSTDHHGLLNLEAPDGPHADDVIAMFGALNQDKPLGTNRIAIFGLTKLLISSAREHLRSDDVVDVIDARGFDHSIGGDIGYIKDNWLEFHATEKYDAILGDDIVCNIGYWQMPLFFEAVARNLKEGGRFVVRTTSVFSPELANPGFEEILRVFRRFLPGDPLHDTGLSLDDLTKGLVYETAWPTLHTDRFYDNKSKSISFKKWNDAVRGSGLSYALLNKIIFDRDLTLTSMRHSDLNAIFSKHFVVKPDLAAYSIWERSDKYNKMDIATTHADLFKKYYRIIVLERNAVPVSV